MGRAWIYGFYEQRRRKRPVFTFASFAFRLKVGKLYSNCIALASCDIVSVLVTNIFGLLFVFTPPVRGNLEQVTQWFGKFPACLRIRCNVILTMIEAQFSQRSL